MRKIFFLFLFALCFLPLLLTAKAGAATPSATDMASRLAFLQGNWLNSSGGIILNIHGQTINGCIITKYEDLVDRTSMGTTVFWIIEESGERMMQLDWRIMGEESDYLFLDGRAVLRRDSSY